VALASAGAVVGSLATGFAFATVVAAGSSDSGVTFSSQPGVATLLAHYSVSPAGHVGSDISDEESQTVALAPKHGGKDATTDLSAGARSDNTVAEPRGSESESHGASFIGQQASAKCSTHPGTCSQGGRWASRGNVYEFDMSLGQPFIADYTQLGINGQAVYFSANMFEANPPFNFAYAELFEANKAKMERGEGDFTADGFFNLRANGPGLNATTGPFLADTVNPALNIDRSAEGTEVFVDTLDGPDPVSGHGCTSAADSCKGLILWKMTNPVGHDRGGSAPVLTGTYVPNIKPYVFSPAADQPSCNACIDALDLRVTATPVVRDGNVYAAWETAINNGNQIVPGIEWAQVRIANAGAENSAESGYYNFSGDTAVSFPALMPDGKGNLVMLFDLMSHNVFPQTRFVIRDGNGQFTGQGVLIKAGESSYRPQLCGVAIPVCRWGDYSASSFDGQGGIWVAGEYANHYDGLNTAPAFGRNWGTWIASVSAG